MNGDDQKKLDFINDENQQDENMGAEEGRLTLSTKLIEIVFENIREMFGDDLEIIKKCKDIANQSELLE